MIWHRFLLLRPEVLVRFDVSFDVSWKIGNFTVSNPLSILKMAPPAGFLSMALRAHYPFTLIFLHPSEIGQRREKEEGVFRYF